MPAGSIGVLYIPKCAIYIDSTMLFIATNSHLERCATVPNDVNYAFCCVQGIEGDSLYSRLYDSFGYLATDGYQGHIFPVVVGETGCTFTQPADLTFMAEWSNWLNADTGTGAMI